ncbi:hypothetical protein QL285_049217 [Trifolium repens]|nr:hypothetical protein QL285_049217 [Trifolium repens]
MKGCKSFERGKINKSLRQETTSMPSSGGSHDRRKAIFVEMTCLKDHGHRSRERVKDSVVRDHYGQRKCHSDRQCYEYQPDAAPGSMTCFKGVGIRTPYTPFIHLKR